MRLWSVAVAALLLAPGAAWAGQRLIEPGPFGPTEVRLEDGRVMFVSCSNPQGIYVAYSDP